MPISYFQQAAQKTVQSPKDFLKVLNFFLFSRVKERGEPFRRLQVSGHEERINLVFQFRPKAGGDPIKET